jgi:hypothetical protein
MADTRMTLMELAKRLEAATGPDRELDGGIAALDHPEVQCVTIGPDHRREDWVYIDRSTAAPSSRPVPRFTASLDAAMSLVPEGWRVRDFGDWEDRWLLTLMNEDTCETVESRSGRGRPALALCAAALRARAQ